MTKIDIFPVRNSPQNPDDAYALFTCFSHLAVAWGWLTPYGLSGDAPLTDLVDGLEAQPEASLIQAALDSTEGRANHNLQILALEILFAWGEERAKIFANLRRHAYLRDVISRAVESLRSLAQYNTDITDLMALFGAQDPNFDPRQDQNSQFFALRMVDALCGFDEFAEAFHRTITVIPMPLYRLLVDLSETERSLCRRHIADLGMALAKG